MAALALFTTMALLTPINMGPQPTWWPTVVLLHAFVHHFGHLHNYGVVPHLGVVLHIDTKYITPNTKYMLTRARSTKKGKIKFRSSLRGHFCDWGGDGHICRLVKFSFSSKDWTSKIFFLSPSELRCFLRHISCYLFTNWQLPPPLVLSKLTGRLPPPSSPPIHTTPISEAKQVESMKSFNVSPDINIVFTALWDISTLASFLWRRWWKGHGPGQKLPPFNIFTHS